MKEEKKPGSKTLYRVGFCLLLAVAFLAVTLQTAAREKTIFTGNAGLFNHYGDENGLFSQGYSSGMDISDQEPIEPFMHKPRISTGKLFGEIFMGMLGNIGGGFLGGLIGSQVIKDDGDGLIPQGAALGLFPGSILGSALGVYAIGNSGEAKGSFGSALLGSCLGECVAVIIMLSGGRHGGIIPFIALPPIGAALLFNSTLKYKSLPISHALLNFNQDDLEVGIPYIHFQCLPGYAKNVKPTVGFIVNLLNIVF